MMPSKSPRRSDGDAGHHHDKEICEVYPEIIRINYNDKIISNVVLHLKLFYILINRTIRGFFKQFIIFKQLSQLFETIGYQIVIN